jgi:hypothetical protein
MTERKLVTEYDNHPTANVVGMSYEILDRMERAVERVRERLLLATSALERAQVPYAVIGGNAVGYWVATKDDGAVRNTLNVDLLVNRNSLPAVTIALEKAGFLTGDLARIGIGRHRDQIGILFSSERFLPHDLLPYPEIETTPCRDGYQAIELHSLTTMKLVAFRTIDRVHLRDMIDVGLIDDSWLSKFEPVLAARLKHLVDTPDG